MGVGTVVGGALTGGAVGGVASPGGSVVTDPSEGTGSVVADPSVAGGTDVDAVESLGMVVLEVSSASASVSMVASVHMMMLP